MPSTCPSFPEGTKVTFDETRKATRRNRVNIRRPLWFLVVIAMARCASIGPGAMSRDRFDYMGTVAET